MNPHYSNCGAPDDSKEQNQNIVKFSLPGVQVHTHTLSVGQLEKVRF